MCGFAVALQMKDSAISRDGLARMRQAILHRGPDGAGEFVSDCVDVGMIHQRLSVIGLDTPAQPRRAGHHVMVYNGEVYNFKELRKELEKEGVAIPYDCDTDVVLAAYQAWGFRAFERFNGMFAIAIFDLKLRTLILARDRFGVKPLYVGDGPAGHRLVASEIQSIEAYSPGYWAMDPHGLDQYLNLGYLIEPFTLKQGVRQLAPGTVEVHQVGQQQYSTHTYWSLADAMHRPFLGLTASDGLSLLTQSVRRQTVADVPVGSFLSGGLDSGLLTTLLRHVSPEQELHCFSAGFTDASYDEVPLAKALADKLHAHHHARYFDEGLLGDCGRLPWLYGGAFADNAALPTYYLSMDAAKHVKVLLSGDGADELFFGYRNHRLMLIENQIKQVLPGWLREHVLGWMAQHYPNHPRMPRVLRAKSTLRALSMSLAQGYCCAMSITHRDVLNKLYSREFRARIEGGESERVFERIAGSFSHDDPMKMIQFIDFKTYLPGSVLTKVDRATMRAGIEARVPFLDNDLATHVLSMPSAANLGWGHHKTQLRNFASGIMDAPNVVRVKKSFTSPLDSWLRTLQYPKFCRMIMSESMLDSGVFNPNAVQALMDDHYYGRANHGTTLWSLCILSKSMNS